MIIIGSVAYHAFVLLLLTSAADSHVGLLFLLNTPVIALWARAVQHERPRAYLLGLLAIVTQLAIYRLAGGRFTVDDFMLITATIVGAMTVLTVVCFLGRKQ